MFPKNSKHTLPSVFLPLRNNAPRIALLDGISVPTINQGTARCTQCEQNDSIYELYASIAK